MLISALPLLLAGGCGGSQPVAGGGQEELDLSRLIVWDTQDCNVVTSVERRNYKTIQTFYDRAGRRVEGLDLGYVLCCRAQPVFEDGLVLANLDDERHLCGYVDRAGRVVIPFQFCWAFPFADGRAVAGVRDSNKFEDSRVGLIDRQGRWVVPPGKYSRLETGSEGRWAFRASEPNESIERWGFLDANGAVVVEPRYTRVGAYREGLCIAMDGNNPACIDRQGRLAFRMPDHVEEAEEFSCGRALVAVDTGKERRGSDTVFGSPTVTTLSYGFLDRQGRMVIQPSYTAAGGFTEGLAPVSTSEAAMFHRVEDRMLNALSGAGDRERWGFIDPNGALAIPMKFNRVSQFSEGLARARQGGKWGFIDKKGDFVIPPRFDWVESFRNGIAVAATGRKLVLIDKQGKTIVNTGTSDAVF